MHVSNFNNFENWENTFQRRQKIIETKIISQIEKITQFKNISMAIWIIMHFL